MEHYVLTQQQLIGFSLILFVVFIFLIETIIEQITLKLKSKSEFYTIVGGTVIVCIALITVIIKLINNINN